jgi:hypothetical protein
VYDVQTSDYFGNSVQTPKQGITHARLVETGRTKLVFQTSVKVFARKKKKVAKSKNEIKIDLMVHEPVRITHKRNSVWQSRRPYLCAPTRGLCSKARPHARGVVIGKVNATCKTTQPHKPLVVSGYALHRGWGSR